MLTVLATALLGGVLIGMAASALLLFSGKIAGISGIVAGMLPPRPGDVVWRLCFLLGLATGGLLLLRLVPEAFGTVHPQAPALLMTAGLLVGLGTRIGNGCTSGHGVCGLSRRSMRSLIATLTFMASGMVTVYVVRHLAGSVWW